MLNNIRQTCSELGERLQHHLQQQDMEAPLLVGIRSGGAWVAEYLHKQLNNPEPLGLLDISFYRDDFTRNGLHPVVSGSELPDTIEDRHIVLIDDVIMSGRTIRAAMNELFDYGRPSTITLVCLVDVGHRELPVQPDLCGFRLDLATNQRVKLDGPELSSMTLIER